MIKASIIIPTYNEIRFIQRCIDSLYDNKSINDCEIIIIDGGSNDGTIDKINELKKKYSNLKLLNNKKKITPSALNIGIKSSIGKYIIRLDAHAEYLDQYIDNAIEALERSSSEIMNIGGSLETVSSHETIISNSISCVLSSKFGVGNSGFRTSKFYNDEYVNTVPFGCFKKEIFNLIGFFNENEHRNEDLEFNKRIIKAGYKILLSANLKIRYYSRDTIRSFLIQAYDNGKIVTNKIRGKDSFHEIRHFVPLIFFIYLIIFSICFFINVNVIIDSLIKVPMIVYICLNITFTILNLPIFKFYLQLITVPFIYFILHATYGIGSISGFLSLIKFSGRYEKI